MTRRKRLKVGSRIIVTSIDIYDKQRGIHRGDTGTIVSTALVYDQSMYRIRFDWQQSDDTKDYAIMINQVEEF